jgi:hypothetical protein
VIKLLRQLEPLKGRRSIHDARKIVDEHPVIYLCPPDALHAEAHEWLFIFETPRWLKFEPPRSFLNKEEAVCYRERLR